jgi:aryl-alcohol dehydrogenase-like predicted oxidoreductase
MGCAARALAQRAASRETTPLPHATSSTRSPGRGAARSIRSAAQSEAIAGTKNRWVAVGAEAVVVPIPGTSHVRRLEENAAAAALFLSADTAEVLARVFAPDAAAGLRYPESHLARLGI